MKDRLKRGYAIVKKGLPKSVNNYLLLLRPLQRGCSKRFKNYSKRDSYRLLALKEKCVRSDLVF